MDNDCRMSTGTPRPYVARVRADVAALKEQLDALLDVSTIRYVNPNTPGSGFSSSQPPTGLGAERRGGCGRLDLLRRYSAWFERFLPLFPHPIPDVQRKITAADKFIRRWVARDGTFDHSIPRTIEQAKAVAAECLAVFDQLISLASRQGDASLRVVPDTN